jgi:hypothetical protein
MLSEFTKQQKQMIED